MTKIKVLQIRDGHIFIAGRCPRVKPGQNCSFAIINEEKEQIAFRVFRTPYYDKTDDDGVTIREAYCFRADLPIYPGARYSFAKSFDPQSRIKKDTVSYGGKSRLQNIEHSYFEYDGVIVKAIDDEIRIYKATLPMRIACRCRFNKTLVREGKGELIKLRRKARKAEAGKRKPVIIVADRRNVAGDNGEAVFKYLMANGYDNDNDIFFSLSRDSADYRRMEKIGKVTDYHSEDYLIKCLTADKLITSATDKYMPNPFGEDYKYVADMIHYEHHFIQHGVTINGWARLLNVTQKGFRTIHTSGRREYEEFLDEKYGYDENEVVLTGMARYDLLEDKKEKLIVFLPTWRKELASTSPETDDTWGYSEKIKNSEFHQKYESLINDERLIKTMKEKGFRGEFYLHPVFLDNVDDFSGNDTIKVCGIPNYRELFNRASIMVTDYSSVNMDFAYMRKPVVYYQFDRESFFSLHGCEHGYFDYGQDGFGKVCSTEKDVIDEIEALLDRNCTMDPLYMDRVDEFYAYRDHDNCKRIVEKIFMSGSKA